MYIHDLQGAGFDELLASLAHYEGQIHDLERHYVRQLDDTPEWWGHHKMLVEQTMRLESEMSSRPEWSAFQAGRERQGAAAAAQREADAKTAEARRIQEQAERERKSAPGSVIAGISAAIALLSLPCIGLQNEKAASFATFTFWVFLLAAIGFGYKYWRRS